MDKRVSLRRHRIFLGERHTSLFNRLMAKCVDGLILIAVYLLASTFWPPLGLWTTLFFCAFQDGFGIGQSVGKRIIGLQVVDDYTGLTCGFRSSFLRNLPFIISVFCVTGFYLPLLVLVIPLIGLELYLIFTLDSGVRLGDILGNTLVIEYLPDV